MEKIFICFALFFTANFGLHAQNLATEVGCATNPPDFGKLSYREADNAVKSEDDLILSERVKKICPDYIINLANQLQEGHLNNDNKTLAIYFLGALHPTDTNSIEVLIENIDFRATKFDLKSAPMRWGKYPAEEALMKIGKPVVNPILNHLPTETSQLRRQLMCDVLKQVLRD
jgi:hypothetical protein